MKNALGLGTVAAVLVMVGVIGLNLLPGAARTGVELPGMPGTSADRRALPVGALVVGRYHIDVRLRASERDDGGQVPGGIARVTFDLPAGWTGYGDGVHGRGWGIRKGDASSPTGLAMAPWAVELFYLDPCHTNAEVRREWVSLRDVDEPGPAGQNLNADRGLGRLWGGWADETSLPPHAGFAPTSPTVTKPSKGTLAGLDGWYVAVRTPTDLDIAACDGGRYTLWLETGGGRRHAERPGQLDRLWVVGVPGAGSPGSAPLVIDAASQTDASAADLTELQAIVDSIGIELLPKAAAPPGAPAGLAGPGL